MKGGSGSILIWNVMNDVDPIHRIQGIMVIVMFI